MRKPPFEELLHPARSVGPGPRRSRVRGRAGALSALALSILLASTPSGRASEAPDRVKETAASNLEFALDLYGRLRTAEGNLFLSPHSISAALAMTRVGARGRTAEQMDRVLRFRLSDDALHGAFAGLRARLEKVASDDAVRIDVANSLWPQTSYELRREFLRTVERWYGVSITPVDYRAAMEAARAAINRWVEERTEEKIQELVPEGILTPLTRLVLVNAIYYQAAWASPFRPEATRKATFHPETGELVTVDMMRQTGYFGVGSAEGCRLLELPYSERSLSMVVLLPEKGRTLESIEKRLDAKTLGRWLSGLRSANLDLQLPRFRFTSRFRLDSVLEALGMRDAFSARDADFSGMDPEPPGPYISAVLHKAFIDVSEKGTEAAAATAVVMALRAAPSRPEPFVVDRPFLFLIRERATGAVLFLGRFVRPES